MKVKNDRLIHIKNDRTLFIGRTINREFMVTKMTPENFEARAREIAEANMVETANGMMVVNEWHVLIAETATALCEAYQSGKSAQGIPSEDEIRDVFGVRLIETDKEMRLRNIGVIDCYRYIRAQAKPVKELELDDEENPTTWTQTKAIESVLKYCAPFTNQMWAATIIGYLLNCPFQDASAKIKERLGGRV